MVYQATRINTPRNSEPQSFLISDAGRLWTSPFSDRPWAMYFKVLRTFFPENVLGSSSVIWEKKSNKPLSSTPYHIYCYGRRLVVYYLCSNLVTRMRLQPVIVTC